MSVLAGALNLASMQKAMGHVLNIIHRGARACLQHMTYRAGALCTLLQAHTEQSYLKLAAALLQFYPSNNGHNLLVLGSANIYADHCTCINYLYNVSRLYTV